MAVYTEVTDEELTAHYGILLIFDEVMSGFRVALGGAQERFGIRPDLAVGDVGQPVAIRRDQPPAGSAQTGIEAKDEPHVR